MITNELAGLTAPEAEETKIPAPTEGDEPALVSAAAHGDVRAFEHLYQRYAQTVYNIALRSLRHVHDAEDATQEIWVKVRRDICSLRDPAAFCAWLYRLTSRSCVDAARKRGQGPIEIELDTILGLPSSDDVEDLAVGREQARLVWQALSALPVRQHLALFLRDVEGLTYQDIAEALETSESAIETLLFRARRSFATAYRELESLPQEACGRTPKVAAALLDKEKSLAERVALSTHAQKCPSCQRDLVQMQGMTRVHAQLPLAAVPASLTLKVLAQVGLGAAASGGGLGLVAAIAPAVMQAKILLAPIVITAAVAVAAIGSFANPSTLENQPSLESSRPSTQPETVANSVEPSARTDAQSEHTAQVMPFQLADAPTQAMSPVLSLFILDPLPSPYDPIDTIPLPLKPPLIDDLAQAPLAPTEAAVVAAEALPSELEAVLNQPLDTLSTLPLTSDPLYAVDQVTDGVVDQVISPSEGTDISNVNSEANPDGAEPSPSISTPDDVLPALVVPNLPQLP